MYHKQILKLINVVCVYFNESKHLFSTFAQCVAFGIIILLERYLDYNNFRYKTNETFQVYHINLNVILNIESM